MGCKLPDGGTLAGIAVVNGGTTALVFGCHRAGKVLFNVPLASSCRDAMRFVLDAQVTCRLSDEAMRELVEQFGSNRPVKHADRRMRLQLIYPVFDGDRAFVREGADFDVRKKIRMFGELRPVLFDQRTGAMAHWNTMPP